MTILENSKTAQKSSTRRCSRSARRRPLSERARPRHGMRAGSPRWPGPRRTILLGLAGVLLLSVQLSVGLTIRDRGADASQRRADQQSIARLESRMKALEVQAGSQADWSAMAKEVQRSGVTVDTRHGLGSGWVAQAGGGGAGVVTNFHGVSETRDGGGGAVAGRRGGRTH